MDNGYILFEGPSAIDGEPIVVIATGFKSPSANEKTGPMVQTWILRQDMKPLEAIRSDNDRSICGDCQHRGTGGGVNRSCYVLVAFAPTSVFAAYKRGTYRRLDDLRLLAIHPLRLGAYGDPAALPVDLVASWCSAAAGDTGRPRHTGYTHQWRTCDAGFRDTLMASVDNDEEQREATAAGWRCFRVRVSGDDTHAEREVVCPASRGLVDCATCLACGGAGSGRRGHISIPVHGAEHLVAAFNGRPNASEVRAA